MRTKKLLAFHGKQSLKDKYLKRVQKHYDLDEIIHGRYWNNGKGCAVGCTVQTNSDAHEAMEKELGIPQAVAHLEDTIFEGLTNGEAKKFPLKFLKAITPGADLSQIAIKMKIFILTDKHNGVIQYANVETKKIIKEIVSLQKQLLKGEDVAEKMSAAESAAWSAESAAWSAAWSAAESAAWSAESAARSAARSAAESAARSAESAAWSAESAARSAARSAAYKAYAKKLLSLLKAAK